MTSLTLQDLRAPYDYVVAESHVSDIQRLLNEARDDARSTSVTFASMGEGGNVLALPGLGREIWHGVDPVGYVRELRDEWTR